MHNWVPAQLHLTFTFNAPNLRTVASCAGLQQFQYSTNLRSHRLPFSTLLTSDSGAAALRYVVSGRRCHRANSCDGSSVKRLPLLWRRQTPQLQPALRWH